MSATRLLVLGAIIQRGSAHGYQVRTDLESWRAGLWGSIGQGSIYHALRTLESAGLIVQASEKPEASIADAPGSARARGPARRPYLPTGPGRAAFIGMLESALGTDDPDMALTMAGIGFMTSLPRARVVALLQRRREALQERRDRVMNEYARHEGEDWEHHIEAIRFWEQSAESAISWTDGLISRLEGGAHRWPED